MAYYYAAGSGCEMTQRVVDQCWLGVIGPLCHVTYVTSWSVIVSGGHYLAHCVRADLKGPKNK